MLALRPFEFAEEPGTNNIVCKFLPGDANQYTEQALMLAWNTSGFSKCLLDKDKLDEAFAQATACLEAAAQEQAANDEDAESAPPELDDEPLAEPEEQPVPDLNPEPILEVTVAEKRDAICEIEIADDGMFAEAVITAAYGGRHLETTELTDRLVVQGVNHGVDFQLLSNVVRKAELAEPGSEVRGIVAKGTEPAQGIPSEFEFLVVPFEDRILQPQSRNDGTLDMHNLGDIEVVDENQPLVRRIPSRPGDNGSTVTGKVIFSEALNDTPFDKGDGTIVSPEDPHLLIAERHGVPLKLGNGMKVDEVLVVRDVDIHTGNVEYDGNVMIKGDVKNSMKVTASGDIYVNGFVENAHLLAEGDIVIKQGVIGKPELMKDPNGMDAEDACYIKGKNVMARYAQNAFLEAVEKVELGAQLLHCHVVGCQELHVGGEAQRKAKLVGGVAHISGEAHIGTLGSIASTPTVLRFDGKAAVLQSEISALQDELDEKLETIHGLLEAIHLIKKQKPNPTLVEKLRKASNTVEQLRAETDPIIGQISERQDVIEEEKKKANLQVYGETFTNVELRFLDIEYTFKEERKKCQYGISNDRWCNI